MSQQSYKFWIHGSLLWDKYGRYFSLIIFLFEGSKIRKIIDKKRPDVKKTVKIELLIIAKNEKVIKSLINKLFLLFENIYDFQNYNKNNTNNYTPVMPSLEKPSAIKPAFKLVHHQIKTFLILLIYLYDKTFQKKAKN